MSRRAKDTSVSINNGDSLTPIPKAAVKKESGKLKAAAFNREIMSEDKRIQKLQAAKAEAMRFIKTCDASIERFEIEANNKYGAVATKEFASAKRASLDLSRTLADLRKSNI